MLTTQTKEESQLRSENHNDDNQPFQPRFEDFFVRVVQDKIKFWRHLIRAVYAWTKKEFCSSLPIKRRLILHSLYNSNKSKAKNANLTSDRK